MSMTFTIKRAATQERESLCKGCRWVHMQRGFRESEEAIFCRFAEFIRAVPFSVAECTDFTSRTMPERWELEKMALLIHVEPKRKKVGFKSARYTASPTDNGKGESD